ncbi:dienelactone hydrolase family protein [Ramlibacter sp. PS4R-6]|uniref:dienelactone hydrolase family protein n=1 Tax=Ramlibacter sp. PS4R-6 TaxID=3133438 RepID=UPI00309D4612
MRALFALLLALFIAPLHAQTLQLDNLLNESVVTIPKKGALFTIDLETTLYKPEGDGPFPVVVINHGKADGNPRFQGRYRPGRAARYFLQRGYAVVVPMRQGFSKSGGSYIAGCHVESNGRLQAEDVKAALDWVREQPWAIKDQLLVVGQSHGGWTTLAFGALKYPGVKGLVNFAGGLRQEGCFQWKEQLANGAGDYAKETTLPSLWFYGDNDSYWDVPTWQAMADKYKAGGANMRLVAFGSFGTDAHGLFNSQAGAKIWEPEVTKFLQQVGLPFETTAVAVKFAAKPATPAPPATNFASVLDETKLPHVKESGREGYKSYLGREMPRAFAISEQGAWGWANGDGDPLQRALDNCARQHKGECKLYSVDDKVVWPEGKVAQ